jgi:multidrug efflux pump subunit AcrB
VIGIMAFAGIGLSPDSTGEFMFSLFAVIAISLLLSWVLAVTVTPLLGHYVFKRGDGVRSRTPMAASCSAPTAACCSGALRFRWPVLVGLVVVTAASYVGFGQVKQQFFPNSNTPLFFAHYTMQQGTPIAKTSAQMQVLEAYLAAAR